MKTFPDLQESTATPCIKGKAGLSYEDQQRHAPRGPFQSVISLKLDSIRAQPDEFFADMHRRKANVSLFQDYRQTGDGTRSFLMGASQNNFRDGRRYCAAFSDPFQAPNGWLYGGTIVLVHPHYTGRGVARFSDNRGLGCYAAITPREKRNPDHVYISVHGALGQRRKRTSRGTASVHR